MITAKAKFSAGKAQGEVVNVSGGEAEVKALRVKPFEFLYYM